MIYSVSSRPSRKASSAFISVDILDQEYFNNDKESAVLLSKLVNNKITLPNFKMKAIELIRDSQTMKSDELSLLIYSHYKEKINLRNPLLGRK